MFVQVTVRARESAQICDEVVGVVQRAVRETLGIDAAPTFVHQTSAADESKGIQPCCADEIRVAILVIAAESFGEAKKRRLFGRIAEISSLELNIKHDQVVTGIIETPRENWSNGYGEGQWLQYLSYQLP
jgi:hypothetical protein